LESFVPPHSAKRKRKKEPEPLIYERKERGKGAICVTTIPNPRPAGFDAAEGRGDHAVNWAKKEREDTIFRTQSPRKGRFVEMLARLGKGNRAYGFMVYASIRLYKKKKDGKR